VVDPILKATVQSELRAEDLVLSEDQEERSNADAKDGERQIVACAHVSEIVIDFRIPT
jgi:hypothetical protein